MREKLDVVHQQQVDIEEALAIRGALPGRDRGMKRLDELIEGQVLDGEPGVDRTGGVADAHQQVSLAQSRPRIDEERVVHRSRRLGHGLCRGHREAIRGSDDEGVESVERIQRDGHAAGLPAARRLSTISEIPRSVSNTPFP